MDVKPAASATSKELINQLFISLLEERAFYVRAAGDAIIKGGFTISSRYSLFSD